MRADLERRKNVMSFKSKLIVFILLMTVVTVLPLLLFFHYKVAGLLESASVGMLHDVTALSVTSHLAIFSLVLFLVIVVVSVVFANSIIRPLLQISGKLNASTGELGKSADAMLDASNKLSASSNEQAAATQESVAAMQEMASMINQTADFSNRSKEISNTVKNMSNEGDQIMRDMVSSMENIQKENEKMRNMVTIIKDISNKTNVINDIVFKTQLLSFNASIEAARAGQHGKGFAVVAEEVGNLANMSGKAAQEIYSLLEDSQKQVEAAVKGTETVVKGGQEVVDKAMAIFKQIAENINLINEQIQRIVEATNEQSKGLEQTGSALKQLDDAARGNSTIALKAQENSAQLEKYKNQMGAIVKILNAIVQGGRSQAIISDKSSIHLEVGHDEECEQVDDDVLDSLVTKQGQIDEKNFTPMN